MSLDLFVPGRLCLFGEHSDWAAGYRGANAEIPEGRTIITGTNQGLHARVAPHPDRLIVTSVLTDGAVVGPREVAMELDALRAEAEAGGFHSYTAGVALRMLSEYSVRGLVVENYRTDLPIRKGLSSSAAACVLTARAFNRLYDLKLTVQDEMECAYLGEIATPSRCGRMDQACAFGAGPILMGHDREHVTVERLRVDRPIHLVVVDLHAEKDTVEILRALHRCYPFATDATGRGVQRFLGPLNAGLVTRAVEALTAGDARRLGVLMSDAQRLFDAYCGPACPEQLTSPMLHRVLAYPALQPHIWGGKGVGSQGDGAAQLIARSETDRSEVLRLLETDLGLSGLVVDLRPTPLVSRH